VRAKCRAPASVTPVHHWLCLAGVAANLGARHGLLRLPIVQLACGAPVYRLLLVPVRLAPRATHITTCRDMSMLADAQNPTTDIIRSPQ